MQTHIKRYRWGLERLREHRIRLTRQREMILRTMANRKLPVPLEVLGKELEADCDLATIYRTAHVFEKAGIVRQVNLSARCACFVLMMPGEHCNYLICNRCGSINDLPESEPIWEFGQRVATQSGYRILQYEAEFYGICPGCQRGSLKQNQEI